MPSLNAASLALLPPEHRHQVLQGLNQAQANRLLADWRFWARAEQLAPGSDGAAPVLRGRPGLADLLRARKAPVLEQTSDWLVWLLLAGRGFGKTRTGGEWIIEQAKNGARQAPISLVGATTEDVRDAMICPDRKEGESGILAISASDFMPRYEPSHRRLRWPNGAVANLYSADEPDRLRGKQHGKVWADELLAWRRPEAWDMLQLGLRLGPNPQAVVTTTPKAKPLLVGGRRGGQVGLLHERSTVITRGSSYVNRVNLAEAYVSNVLVKYEGTRLGRQELYAEILADVEGALWALGMIDGSRWGSRALPQFKRVVVAIDPQASAGTGATNQPDEPETGIVVAATAECWCRGGDEGELHAFVLEDASGSWSPNQWGRRAVDCYRTQQADRVIGEQNNGGAMVESTVRTVDPHVAYKAVHASQGKRTRAEPVAALYEQGKVHHVGAMPILEDQLCTWDGTGPSPNRLDACVWAISELMLGATVPTFRRRSGGERRI